MKRGKQESHPKELREIVLEEYFNTEKSARELGEYYGVSPNVIWVWACNHRKKEARKQQAAQAVLQKSTTFTTEPEKEEVVVKKELSNDEKDRRIAELEKALEYEQMKVAVLDKMIEITEREFKIPVRKKYGTKQSTK